MVFHIHDLIEKQEYIPTISRWMWEEWDKSRGWTLEQSIKETESWCRRDAIPWGVVAMESDTPIGAMSLVVQDHDDHPELSPWMACQYVVPTARGSNIAMALSMALEDRARRLNIKRLHMWTEHNPGVYARYGYFKLFPSHWNGRPVTVLAKDITA